MPTVKVANVTEDGRWLGPQARIAKAASKLRAHHDIETVVVCPEKDSERLRRRLSRAEVGCRTISMHHLTRHVPELIRYVLFFVPEIARLINVLRDEAVDVVHCNGPWQIKGMIAAKIVGIPAVWHLNDTRGHSAVQLVFNILAPVLASAFIAASRRTEKHYLNESWAKRKRIWIVQAPVDTSQFDPCQTQPSQAITKYDGVKIATVGSVNPEKGIGVLVEAANRVQAQRDETIHFFVVGPIYESQRDYGERLQQEVEAEDLNVHFLGYRDDIPEILKASDIYVCSSNSEASPTVVWEAMAMKLPIVSTDVGDVQDFVEGKEPCGYVVPPRVPEKLAGAISTLVENFQERRQFSNRAREIATSELDLDICARRHASVYRDLS